MSLLDRAREMKAARIVKFEVADDGIEGKLVHVKKFTGRDFSTWDFFLELDSSEKVVVRASSGTVLFRSIRDAAPGINDRMAILYCGQIAGNGNVKEYKSWSVLVERAPGSVPVDLADDKEKKKARQREPGDDDVPPPDDSSVSW